jgi:hypothetical protein
VTPTGGRKEGADETERNDAAEHPEHDQDDGQAAAAADQIGFDEVVDALIATAPTRA